MVNMRNKRKTALDVLIAKEVSSIGLPLPSSNVFTSNMFYRSFEPFKKPIRKSLGNLDPRYGRRRRW